jgi:hypothetical protein
MPDFFRESDSDSRRQFSKIDRTHIVIIFAVLLGALFVTLGLFFYGWR